MATVTKDFRIKSGLVVEGTNGTINGSDILTEDAITGGTQTNISVTYNPTTKLVSFVAENGVGDSDTDDLTEGTANLYFTDQRARDAVSVDATGPLAYDPLTGEFDLDIGTGLNVVSAELNIDLDYIADLTTAQTLTNKTLGAGNVLGADLDADSVYTIINLPTPENAGDAASKSYVDSVAEGLHVHASAVAASTANINLAAGGLLEIDGVQLVADNRVLVKNQSTTSQNGIYLAKSGAWVRAADFDSPAEVDGGDFIFVTGGDTYADTGWVQTADSVVTIGSDPILFTQFSGAGTYQAGTNLELDGNTFNLLDSISLTSVTADLTGDVTGTVSDISNHDTSDLAEDPSGTGTSGTWYFTNQRAVDALEAVVPNFTEIDVNSVAKQVAATTGSVATASTVTAYQFAKADYRSAEFLVKASHGTHTEVSKVILTLDITDNIAITEYAVVGTNGSLSSISADINGSNVRLRVTTAEDVTTVKVVGTLLA